MRRSHIIKLCSSVVEGPLHKKDIIQVSHGTFLVYFIKNELVLKVFKSHEQRPFLREVSGLTKCQETLLLKHHSPRIVRCGEFKGKKSRMFFVITTVLPGLCYRDLPSKRVFLKDLLELSVFLGRCLRELHNVGRSSDQEVDEHTMRWCLFLSHRAGEMMGKRWLKRLLTPSAHAQLASYWPSSWTSLFNWGDRTCFLHGDLNNENVLIHQRDKEDSVFSIIDFGDSTFGHRIFDFIAIHLSIFSCDKDLFVHFLHAYGLDVLPDPRTFAYVCMIYCLLTPAPALKTAVSCLPEIRECQTLDEIAVLLFDVTSRTHGIWSSQFTSSSPAASSSATPSSSSSSFSKSNK